MVADERLDVAIAAIDWTRPWFARFAAAGLPIATAVRNGTDLREALNAAATSTAVRNAGGLPLRFVAQQALPAGVAYESHIHATACVPTRDNLHDFFNGLVWLHFPQAKAVLNRIQADAIAADGVGSVRGAVRDAATLFDENGVLFVGAVPDFEAALRGFQWRRLFVDLRADWGERCGAVPFGHALLEKLVSPYKALTAHAWPMIHSQPVSAAAADSLDALLAAALDHTTLRSRGFAPLPVMGIPGWCGGSVDPAYYDDTMVFRSGRRQTARG